MIESSIPPSKERSPPISCYANGVFDSDQTGLRFRSIAVGIVGNGDDARMAKMRTRRAPFTDPRDGRLKFAITCTRSWGRFAAVHESAFGT